MKKEHKDYLNKLREDLGKDTERAFREQSLYYVWKVMWNAGNLKEMLTALFYSDDMEYQEFKDKMEEVDHFIKEMRKLVFEIEVYSDIPPYLDLERKGVHDE